MTAQTEPSRKRRSATTKQTTFGGLVLALLVALYSFGRPILNEKMGWDLPELPKQNSTTEVETATTATSEKIAIPKPTKQARNQKDQSATVAPEEVIKQPAETTRPPIAKPEAKPGPLAGKVSKPELNKSQAEDAKLLYGLLKDLGGERYVSPAGLMYTHGGAEGHRLEHLERHTQDDPGRPGKHGVFDGGMEGALATIDRAYEHAKTGTRTTKELDEGRTVYTVDMGSRIGFIGGQDGNRQRKPMARRVKLVLDNDRVITAYPL